MIELETSEFFTKSSEGGILHLDKITPEHPAETDKSLSEAKLSDTEIGWSHFITLAFPQNHKFNIKHHEYMANGSVKISMEPIKYRDCTVMEQYLWIQWIFNRFLNRSCNEYDFFFEHTLSGDLHLHGRVTLFSKTHIKDIKLIFHRMFGLSVKYIKFCDVKVYDKTKWNDYQNKYSERKLHQKSELKNFSSFF